VGQLGVISIADLNHYWGRQFVQRDFGPHIIEPKAQFHNYSYWLEALVISLLRVSKSLVAKVGAHYAEPRFLAVIVQVDEENLEWRCHDAIVQGGNSIDNSDCRSSCTVPILN